MNIAEEKFSVLIICPHCKGNFLKEIVNQKKNGLSAVLIKDHLNSVGCAPFVAFIDNNGKHRGSQKLDSVDENTAINDALVEEAEERIKELNETIRFYHLKFPRKDGRGFEQKVANVSDRRFMSSKDYVILIDYLSENEETSLFGGIAFSESPSFSGGLLVYGKYLGMIYTIFWKDQKSIQNKTFEELMGFANLTVEQLIESYDIMDLFF